MSKPVIDARSALLDLRSGMDETSMMAKYNLTAKGMVSLMKKLLAVGALKQDEIVERLPTVGKSLVVADDERASIQKPGRRIKAQDALRDINAGMGDAELMRKYDISAQDLQHVIEQLVSRGLLKPEEQIERHAAMESTVDVLGIRGFPDLDRGFAGESAAPEPIERLASERSAPAWTCPNCNKELDQEYEECPICGIIVKKFLERQIKH